MKHSEFRIETEDGTCLYAQAWKPDEAPVCVVGIVHGLGEHSTRYAPVAARLVEAGCCVVGYDQRGHGKTKGEMPPFETLLQDLDALLQYLVTVSDSPRILYGQSLGGGLVINYALSRQPKIAGVIASSPLLKTAHEPPAWKLLIGRTLGKIWPGLSLGTGIDPNHLSHDCEAIERYVRDPMVHRRVSAALGMSMLDAGLWSMEHASRLSVPMLLMHGTDDQNTCHRASEQFSKLAHPHCQLKLWPGLYHDLHFEADHEQVLKFVVDWIHTTVSC
jgi:alpha-beta hydrolase superfamily lysophospholipase